MRGGGWNSGPVYLRSSLRDRKQPQVKDYALGLRVLRELPQSDPDQDRHASLE